MLIVSSNIPIKYPENIFINTNIKSQVILFLYRVNIGACLIFPVKSSSILIAPNLWKSSVSSSSAMSNISSIVTIPIRAFFASTTGMYSKSYFLPTSTASSWSEYAERYMMSVCIRFSIISVFLANNKSFNKI